MTKPKKGQIREDGKIFYRRSRERKGKIYEYWLTKEQFEKKVHNEKKTLKKYRKENKSKIYKYKADNWEKILFLQAKSHCKIRSVDSPTIDEKWIKQRFEKQGGKCYWLSITLAPSQSANHPLKPSLDRLDCSKGYTEENTVISSLFANMGRKNTPVHEMKKFIEYLKENLPRGSL